MTRRFDTYRLCCFAACVYLLLASIGFDAHYAMNADNAAQIEFARRMLAGGHYRVDFLDDNPPTSFLAYIPAALLLRFGMPAWSAVTFYGDALVALSAALIIGILQYLRVIPRPQIYLIAFVYILANLMVGGVSFAERDQLVLLGLLPLLLAQHAINERTELPRPLLYFALTFGALALCIKPHYAIAPLAMIVWRLGQERTIRALMRADVAVLAVGATSCIGGIFLFFPAFIHDVLPDVLSLYARTPALRDFPRWQEGAAGALLFVCAISMFDGARRRLFVTLALAAFAAYAAYVLQDKGFSYHLIPARCLLLVAASAMAAAEPQLNVRPHTVALSAMAVLLLLFPFRPNYPTHEAYANLPVAQMIDKECGSATHCPFFIDNDFAYMTYESAFATGSFAASRFNGLWFEPALACGLRPDLFGKYAGMIAADLNHWHPAFIALNTAPPICAGKDVSGFDFATFWSRDPAFADAWSHYKFERSDTFDRSIYFKSTDGGYTHIMTFKIYRRVSS